MTVLIRPPHRIKKKRSQNAQEILDRLQSFLDQNTEEPAEILYSFWEDQRNAITYHELRDAVKAGDLTQKQIEEWKQDYSVLVANKLTSAWNMAMAAGPSGQPILDNKSFSFNTQNPGIAAWIKERGAEFVTSCTSEQKRAIQSLLAKKIVEEHTVDELARLIRPCIGLTESDAKSTMKLYDSVANALKQQHPRMKPESVRKKALDAAQKYAEKKHRQRAFTIAQTELEFAYNRGADFGIRQAQEENLLGLMRKRWITAGDENVCSICNALDGTEIEMDDNFDFKGRVLFPGHKMLPPAHPRCACAVEYIEVEPPRFVPDTAEETAVEDTQEDDFLKFENGDEAYDFFGKKPDRSLRRENREEYDRLLGEYNNRSQYGKWSNEITTLEGRSIENYTGPDYSAVNGLLRHEMTENQVKLWNDTCNMDIQDMIDNITSAVSKFDLEQNIMVYRTCEKDVLENLKTEVGSIFHDDGFGSTSVTWSKKAGGNIRMEIEVPKGKGVGAWVNPLNGYEGTDRDEYEFLLNRGTDYKVLGVEESDGDTIVRMRVIGRTEKQWSYATKEEVIEQWKRRGVYDEESTNLL